MTYFSDYTRKFFFLFGEIADEFCNARLQNSNINYMLLNHLKNIGYKRVIFYRGGGRGFYCLDEDSYNLAFKVKSTTSSKSKSKVNLLSRGPLKRALKKETTTTQQELSSDTRLTIKVDDSDMNRYVTNFMGDNKTQTVIIFENFYDFLTNTDNNIKRDVGLDFNSYLHLSNKNIIIFLNPPSISAQDIDQVGIRHNWTFLTNLIYQPSDEETKKLSKNSIILSGAQKDEIRNLLNYLRLTKSLPTKWEELDEIIDIIAKYTKESFVDETSTQTQINLKKLKENLKNLDEISKDSIIKTLNIKVENTGFDKLKELKGMEYLQEEIEKKVKHIKTKIKIDPNINKPIKNDIKRFYIQPNKLSHNENLHIALTGNPGTGKTTVAKIIAEVYKDNGILDIGHIVKVTRADLVAGYVGQTAIKTQKKINQAIGGVLFIDEAYTLVDSQGENSSGSFGQEAIDTIMEAMTDRNGEFAVIIAGYKKDIAKFLKSNEGLDRRFATQIEIKDYPPEVLQEVFCDFIKKDGYQLDDEFKRVLPTFIKKLSNRKYNPKFSNMGEIKNLVSGLEANTTPNKIISQSHIPQKWQPYNTYIDTKAIEEVKKELDTIIGLDEVKDKISTILDNIEFEISRGNDEEIQIGHFVFYGNPGIGKTMSAQMLANIFYKLGLLGNKNYKKVEKNDLVGVNSAETLKKTEKILKESLGGVLFVDETYTLTDDSLGEEALNKILTFMEENRDSFILIFAGYEEEMERIYNVNKGLRSRFKHHIYIQNYKAKDMVKIFEQLAKEKKMELSDEFKKGLEEHLEKERLKQDFSNIRYLRDELFDKIHRNFLNRWKKDKTIKHIFEVEDLDNL